MKSIIVLTAVLLAIGASQAAAQATCADSGALKKNAISSALGGKWACAKDGTSGNETFCTRGGLFEMTSFPCDADKEASL